MSTSRRVGCGALLVAAGLSLGCTGADGAPGQPGPAGPSGDAGVIPPLKNDVSGTVTDGMSALAGVSVTAKPGTAIATTDAKGAFSLPGLDVGAYGLAFHLVGYLDQRPWTSR